MKLMRALRLAALLAAIVVWDWSPMLPPEPMHSAAAQGFQANQIIQASRTSVIATNSVTADTPLWTNTLPVGLAAPLHLRLEGTITTTPVTTAQIGCSYQSSAGVLTPNASLSIGNGGTLSISQTASAPFALDFWVRPQPVWRSDVSIGEGIYAMVAIASAANTANDAGAATVPTNGSQSGMLDMSSTTAANINCTWHWGAVNASNNLTIINGILQIGE